MVHQYKNNGYNIVLDVCSGSVHVVDELVYDMIALYEDHDLEAMKAAIIEKYNDAYSDEDITEAYDDIRELVDSGQLFTEDVYKDVIIDLRRERQSSKHCAYTLHMIAIWLVNIVLPMKVNIMGRNESL